MKESSYSNLELRHSEMKEARKIFSEALQKHHDLYGKAVVGSIIKSTGIHHKGRKFVVISVEVGVSVFTSDMGLRASYSASLLDGKGNKVIGKVIKFSDRDFDLIKR